MAVVYFITWAHFVCSKTQCCKLSLFICQKGWSRLHPRGSYPSGCIFSAPFRRKLRKSFNFLISAPSASPGCRKHKLILPSVCVLRLLTQPVHLCAQTMWAAVRCSLICISGITSQRRPCVFTSGKSSWLWSTCTKFVPLKVHSLFRQCDWEDVTQADTLNQWCSK